MGNSFISFQNGVVPEVKKINQSSRCDLKMKTYTSIVFLHLGILLHQVVDSRIVLRRDAENQPSEEKALECLELGDFVAVFNETSESFDCLQIAAQGPCQKGHWLFLDKDNPGGPPVCQPRECEIENEVFYKVKVSKLLSHRGYEHLDEGLDLSL